MNGNRLFVDTNILLYFLKGQAEVIELIIDKDLAISFITEIELLSFPSINKNTEEQIKNLLKACTILNLNQDIKDSTIDFRKKYKIKLPDAVIAASAYSLQIPLLTGDKGFRKIQELDILIFEL